jgi:hypothetical protein
VAGLVAAIGVAELLAASLRLSLVVETAVIGAAIATFLALAWLTKVVTGRESLTYYHHEVAVLAVAGAVCALAGGPVLAHLDVTALGLGAFLACGRLGCLSAGCCHGRPAAHGIRYRAEHVDAGFPRYLEGVPVIPVALIESLAAAAIVAIGALTVLDRHDPGAALTFYVTAYALVRLALEELRGDIVRRYAHGLSEAQWTSLALIVAVTAAQFAGVLPAGGRVVVPALAAIELSAIVLVRRRRPALLDPAPVRELLAAARALRGRGETADVVTLATSSGVRLSGGATSGVEHYSLSLDGDRLLAADADRLARAIAPSRPFQLVAGTAAVHHLVFDE